MQEVEISDNVKDRRLLAEDSSLRGEGELRLTNVEFIDDGRYVCRMSNELGSFEQPVDLHILGMHLTTNQDTSSYYILLYWQFFLWNICLKNVKSSRCLQRDWAISSIAYCCIFLCGIQTKRKAS